MFKLEEGWLTLALLCAMIVVAASGVAAAGWTEGLSAAWVSGLTGLLAGLALAKSRFTGPTAFLFATVYGLFAVGYFIGLDLNGTWNERSTEIVVRLNAFLYKALYGGTSRDPLPFPVAVALIFWFIGVLSAWSVFRRAAVWPAIIPAGVGLMVNAYYYLGPNRLDLYLAVYVLLALMFVARMNLLDREREWQSARVVYSPDLRLDFLRAGLAAALAGVLVAWAAPSLAASPRAASVWRQTASSLSFVREGWMRMFASVRGYGQSYTDFYGETLTLGGPARLSTEPVMDVRINAVAGEEDQEVDAALGKIQRYYWRAASFARYSDGAWAAGDVEFKEWDPNRTRLPPAAYLQRRQVSLAFTVHSPAISMLYTASQMQWVDRPTTLEITFDRDGALQDVSSMRAHQVVRRGETYQVVASVSVADATSLREAGTEYPEWVTNSFLQLPPEITPRTRELAQQIVTAAGAATPYDQAQAVTQWLRDNITYDQNVDAAPPNAEPVDFVLFTSRRGYCNYYASAQVVLLRALGIPARLAVGMSQGKLDASTATYQVIEQNAHAWPEVFFPGYGWVEFEPTVSQAPLVRPERAANEVQGLDDDNSENEGFERGPGDRDPLLLPEEMEGQTPVEIQQTWADRMPWAPIAASLAVTALAVVALALVAFRAGVIGWESLGWVGQRVMRARGAPLPSSVGVVYLQLERVAQWLGLASGRAITPFERAAALGSFLPEVRPGVDTITREYVAEQYSPRPVDPAVASQAWLRIRFKLWHDAIRSFLLDLLEEDEER